MTIAPGQRESKRTVLVKELAFALFSLLLLAGSIYSTVVVATGSADLYTPGMSKHARADLLREIGGHLGTFVLPLALARRSPHWTRCCSPSPPTRLRSPPSR